jgi:TP901 family phage tail tape measure protein
MSEFLPPVVAVLAANITEYEAGLAAAQTQMTEFVATQNAALTEMQARFATAGAAAGEELAGGVAAAAPQVTAATAEIDAAMADVGITAKATAAEVQASFATMGASLEATGAKMAALSEEESAMLAKMQADNAALAASTREATLANAALGDAMAGTAAKTEATNTTLGMSNKVLLGVGAAAIGAAYETTKMAGDFNMATERLVTSAGEAEQNVDMVRKGILGMAGAVGYSADELAKAMYTVESGGQHGAAGLKVLQAAAEGAKTENADLKEVADAVTSVLVDYHLKAEDAADVTSKLVAATSQGKTTFQELASSMSAVLPVASANHVSLNDILGDLASMTVHGMSAQQAAQNLTDAIRHMAAPTQLQSKELAILGVKSQDLSDMLGQKGLSGTIDYIGEHIRAQMGPGASKVILDLGTALNGLNPKVQELAGHVLDGSMTMKDYTKAAQGLDVVSAKQAMSFAALAGSTHTIGTEQLSSQAIMQSYTKAMRDAMGDATGLNVALMIGGENAGVTANAIKVVSGATAEAGGHVKGWADIQKEFNTQLAQAKDGFGALAITIGEMLLPVLTPLVHGLAAALQFLSAHPAAAAAAAAVIGGVLVIALSAAAVAAWSFTAAMLANPVVWIVAGIVAAIALLGIAAYELIQHWAGVKSFFGGLWDAVKGFFVGAWHVIEGALSWIGSLPSKIGSALSGLGGIIKDAASTAWHWILDKAKEVLNATVDFAKKSPYEIGYALGSLIGILAKLAVDAWNAFTDGVSTAWNATWSFITSIPGWIWNGLTSLPGLLYNAGSAALRALGDGASALWNNYIWPFITSAPGKIWDALTSLPGLLWNAGSIALHAMGDGISAAWGAVWGFITSIPGWIMNALGNLGSLLWNAGKSIINGLLNGIKAAYNDMIDFVSGIGAGIAAHKGPIDYDRTLLTPHGNAIMDGLLSGLQNGHLRVQRFVSGIAGGLSTDLGALVSGALSSHFPGGQLSVTGGFNTALGGLSSSGNLGDTGGGGQVVNVHLNVQGHVWKTRDLVKEIQEQLLRHGIRNNTPGIDYAFG